MKTTLLLFATSLSVFFITSCKKNRECELPLNVNQSSIEVIFKDSTTGRYLYAESNPLYNKDSLRIFNQNNTQLFLLYSTDIIPGTASGYVRVNFGNIYEQSDSASFNTQVCKSFYVKYNANESDTIIACFKSKKTECGSVFEVLKVYNKGKLIATVNDQTFAEITVLKN